MVHPDYTGTGAERKDKTGKIIAFYPEKNIVTVMFRNRYKAVYAAASLLRLRGQKSILLALRTGLFMNGTDCRIMLSVYRFAYLGQYAKALKLAMTNYITRFYCTISCQQYLDRQNRDDYNIQ